MTVMLMLLHTHIHMNVQPRTQALTPTHAIIDDLCSCKDHGYKGHQLLRAHGEEPVYEANICVYWYM